MQYSIVSMYLVLIYPFWSTEEASVRGAAFGSTKTVADCLPQNTFQDQYEKVVSRLAKSEWFTARMSSAGLICAAYPRFTPEQQQAHLSLFIGLCQDDTPMVRRVAAQNLGEMVRNVVESNGRETLAVDGVVTTSLIPLYEELASNDQPVRRFVLKSCCFPTPHSSPFYPPIRIRFVCKRPKIVWYLDMPWEL